MNASSNFDFRNRVIIDGDPDLVAVVTGFMFREGSTLVEVCWLHNGDAREARIEEWRLLPA